MRQVLYSLHLLQNKNPKMHAATDFTQIFRNVTILFHVEIEGVANVFIII